MQSTCLLVLLLATSSLHKGRKVAKRQVVIYCLLLLLYFCSQSNPKQLVLRDRAPVLACEGSRARVTNKQSNKCAVGQDARNPPLFFFYRNTLATSCLSCALLRDGDGDPCTWPFARKHGCTNTNTNKNLSVLCVIRFVLCVIRPVLCYVQIYKTLRTQRMYAKDVRKGWFTAPVSWNIRKSDVLLSLRFDWNRICSLRKRFSMWGERRRFYYFSFPVPHP